MSIALSSGSAPGSPGGAAAAAVYSFRPFNVGRLVTWSLFALLLLSAPLAFTSGLSLTILSQMGIAIVACLSYNMLLGQGGMLSFGHAVYSGLGAFFAIHALNMVSAGTLLSVRACHVKHRNS